MAINLEKGQRISLKKEAPGLTNVMCGLGWDVAQPSGGGLSGVIAGPKNFDLDASVVCLDKNNKVGNKQNLVYYANLRHPSGAINHCGDNLTGKGEGDDEQILVYLENIPPEIVKLAFVVNIYHSVERKQDFGQVKNAFVRLVNMANNQEIARYNLSGGEYAGQTGMIMAEIYRDNGEWQMEAIGKGLKVSSLERLLLSY